MANIKCPCGQQIEIPFGKSSYPPYLDEYDIMSVKCPNCGRIAGAGNSSTGQITSWITPRQMDRANAEYQQQAFSADMNEFYGRGNHPF